jgi:hypothetical protein
LATRDLIDIPSAWPIWNSAETVMAIGGWQFAHTGPDTWRPSFLGLMDWVRVSGNARYSGESYAVPTSEPASDATTLLFFAFDDVHDSTVAHDSGPNHWDGLLGVAPGYYANPTSPTFVPEPATLALVAVGAAALLACRRRQETMVNCQIVLSKVEGRIPSPTSSLNKATCVKN